jgi:hypothetical protein
MCGTNLYFQQFDGVTTVLAGWDFKRYDDTSYHFFKLSLSGMLFHPLDATSYHYAILQL